jgi:hypothetical protein
MLPTTACRVTLGARIDQKIISQFPWRKKSARLRLCDDEWAVNKRYFRLESKALLKTPRAIPKPALEVAA